MFSLRYNFRYSIQLSAGTRRVQPIQMLNKGHTVICTVFVLLDIRRSGLRSFFTDSLAVAPFSSSMNLRREGRASSCDFFPIGYALFQREKLLRLFHTVDWIDFVHGESLVCGSVRTFSEQCQNRVVEIRENHIALHEEVLRYSNEETCPVLLYRRVQRSDDTPLHHCRISDQRYGRCPIARWTPIDAISDAFEARIRSGGHRVFEGNNGTYFHREARRNQSFGPFEFSRMYTNGGLDQQDTLIVRSR